MLQQEEIRLVQHGSAISGPSQQQLSSCGHKRDSVKFVVERYGHEQFNILGNVAQVVSWVNCSMAHLVMCQLKLPVVSS